MRAPRVSARCHCPGLQYYVRGSANGERTYSISVHLRVGLLVGHSNSPEAYAKGQDIVELPRLVRLVAPGFSMERSTM